MPPRDPASILTLAPVEDIGRREILKGAVALPLLAALGASCGDDDDGGAAETRTFEHWGGVTEIPLRPKRVVTLHDANALLPLLELGWKPVGSTGSTREDGSREFRYTQGYDTSDVEFVGNYGEPDLEAIAALEPDLIVGNEDELAYEQLSGIAPTVLLQAFDRPMFEILRQFADLTDSLDRFETLMAEYEEAVASLREDLPRPPEEIVLSMVQFAFDGTFYLGGNGDTVEAPVRDIGFARPAAQVDSGYIGDIPLERIREHDGDVILTASWPDWRPEVEAMQQPVVKALDAMERGEFHVYDGDIATGLSFGSIHAFMGILRQLLVERPVNFPA